MNGVKLVIFTMAGHSGMGRFASELVMAADRYPGIDVVFVAPPQEREPEVRNRQVFASVSGPRTRIRKLLSLFAMNVRACQAVWRETQSGAIFAMVDLYSTVPLSILPAVIARAKGATCVLNLHDVYPHALRYPVGLRWLEKFIYRASYRFFDAIAVMNQSQARRLVSEVGFQKARIIEIAHGVFEVSGVAHPKEHAPTRFLLLGSIRQNKMTLESIRAFKGLRSRRDDVVLRVAGAPRREEKQYWLSCQSELTALDDTELFVRYIDDEELGSTLSDVDAVLCPYDGFDSQSGVSVIAVSNGIPLIATPAADVDGCSLTVDVQVPVTTDSILLAMERLCEMPRAERQRRAHVARESFRAAAHWDQAIERIIEIARYSKSASNNRKAKRC